MFIEVWWSGEVVVVEIVLGFGESVVRVGRGTDFSCGGDSLGLFGLLGFFLFRLGFGLYEILGGFVFS